MTELINHRKPYYNYGHWFNSCPFHHIKYTQEIVLLSTLTTCNSPPTISNNDSPPSAHDPPTMVKSIPLSDTP